MSSIPGEIQEEILLRLPVKSILRFKSVCKHWCRLIRSHEFLKDHLNLSNEKPRLMVRDAAHRVENDGFYSVDYDTVLSWTTCVRNGAGAVVMDKPTMTRKNGDDSEKSRRFIQILGSCDGLLFLGVDDGDKLILWNPSTKEYKEIIPPPDNQWNHSYGFGYDRKINDYKLVHVAPKKVHVYTLKSKSWRRVDTLPYRGVCERAGLLLFTEQGGLLLNGCLHWTGASTTNRVIKAIASFDISSEKFMNLPIPEELLLLPKGSFCDLKVLGDALCLVCGFPNVRVDAWVMQSYGAKESWTKRFTTIDERITTHPYVLKFYWYLNGDILIQVCGGFGLYNQKNDKLTFLNIMDDDDDSMFLQSESYVESLVSL